MCNSCTTYNEQVQVYRDVDPTRTATLRKAFVQAMDKRFNELIKVINEAIITQDVFGFDIETADNLTVQGYQMTVPPKNAFAFTRSSQQVEAFMNWLRAQVNAGILEIGTAQQLGVGIEGAWTNVYIQDSYKRGIIRARSELRKAGYNVPTLVGQDAALQASFNSPFHIDRVGLLYTRTYSELVGITSQMESQIARVLAQGMIDGDGPRVIAAKLRKVIDGLGDFSLTDTLGRYIPAKRRAEILARTEIIRAHHQAMVQEYKNWRLAGVRVQAEFLTAQDNRVCADCQALEGEIFDLDTAMRIIPVHPQCRCITLPIRANETILINSAMDKFIPLFGTLTVYKAKVEEHGY